MATSPTPLARPARLRTADCDLDEFVGAGRAAPTSATSRTPPTWSTTSSSTTPSGSARGARRRTARSASRPSWCAR